MSLSLLSPNNFSDYERCDELAVAASMGQGLQKDRGVFGRGKRKVDVKMLAKIHDTTLSAQQQRELLQKFILSADFRVEHKDVGVTKVHVGVSKVSQEFSDNLSGAKKLNKLGYNVYLLPTSRLHFSPDYILEKEGKIWFCELKTIYGKNSIEHRLKKAKYQADNVVINIVGHIDSRKAAYEIKAFFEESDRLKEVIVLKRGKPIYVRRKLVAERKFVFQFMRDWYK